MPMGDDQQPHLSSCSGGTASSSGGGGSSSSPSPSPVPPPLPPPFPCAPASIPFPQQQQQLLQQLQQHQRLFSLHLAAPSPAPLAPPATLPLKHPLPLPSASPSPVPAPAPSDRRDDCWSEEATFTLIQAWGDCYLELNRGNLKQKHWRDVADAVNRCVEGLKAPKTDIQCKNRIDTLKKKYKLEKGKISVGGERKWAFFDRLDELLGNSKKPKKPLPVKPRASAPPLLPAITLPAKRTLEDADQAPQLYPSFVAAPNHWPSPAANHVTSNHAGRAFNNHGGSTLNYPGSAQDRATVVPYPNNSNHGGSAHHHFGSNANHLASAVDATSKSKESPHTSDSCPNGESAHPKRLRHQRHHTDPIHELAQAITKFGEVYERTEIAKQQMSAEIEKQRMIFAKDLELQRLQYFTQTQVELAKLKLKFRRGQTDNC